jgi:hypothetical protein
MNLPEINNEIRRLEDVLESLYQQKSDLLISEGVYLCVVCKQSQVNPRDGYDTCELCARSQ